jgi:hypothetical protein
MFELNRLVSPDTSGGCLISTSFSDYRGNNINDNGLKSWMFAKGDDFLISGNGPPFFMD